jgi:hypothetical protein
MRLFQYRIEHRREIAGRGADDLQDFGGRSLLLARLPSGDIGEPGVQPVPDEPCKVMTGRLPQLGFGLGIAGEHQLAAVGRRQMHVPR